MKKNLRLSTAIFKKAEKVTKDEMNKTKGTGLIGECCHMFCSISGDSIGELIYFLPSEEE